MKRSWQSLFHLLLFSLCLAGADFFRGRLIEERRALNLLPRRDEEAASAPSAGEGRAAVRQVVLTSAGLGLFRALAIDFLWLRAVRLQEQAQYFDASLLSRVITSLEPRIPQVWNFQAFNLSYNISRPFPARERYPWVLQGIELLRDQALRFNPESASIYHQLSFLFQHKIGLDFDDAGYLYRSELARTFEVSRESPEGRELFQKWKLQPERVQALEKRLGMELDFRAAESHASYWAERGLEALRQDSSSPGMPPLIERQLRHVANASLLQLFSGGHPVKAPLGRMYVFVPDLRFLKAAGGVLAEDLAKRPAAEAAERAYLEYLKKAVSYLFLFRRGEEAEALFEKWLERLRPAVSAAIAAEASFQEVLLEMLSPGVLGGPKEGMLQALASCLEASLLLRAAGKDGSSEEVLSRGFLDLARLLHRESLKRLGEGALAPFEAYWIQSAERLSNRWKADPKTAHLAGLVQPPSPDLLPEKGAGIGLPEPHELLFRVDRLDPLRCPKDGL